MIVNKKATILLLSVVFFFAANAGETLAQKRFSKSYPASENIRLQLMNRSGTITVEGWNKKEVRISAVMEKPVAQIVPRYLNGTILINVVQDNKGNEIGDTNFDIKVPYFSSIDIETGIGNLNVSNVQGGLVRAHITTEGDIVLTNIGASSVSAENITGDIFYNGAIREGGIYSFKSVRGNISLQIPFQSSFRLVATAPSTRNISLGSFANAGMSYVGNGRRVVGKIGGGSASLTVTNHRGNISFIQR
ncbi:MAG: DUF4097 family beta strand repeat-containing protein [Aridibacter sp.]